MRTTSRTQQAYLLDSLNSAVILVDGSLAIRYLNAAAESLLGSSSRQLLDTNLLELLVEPDKHESRLVSALDHQGAYAEDSILLHCGPDRNTLASGTISPITEGGGETALVLELLPRDRHESIARGESVVMQQHVSRALVRGLAHEIKNPLGGIRGAAQLLERELVSADQREFTQVIIGEVDRLQNLVNRMLGPRQPPELQLCNVHEVLERVRSLVGAEKSLKIERDYDPSIPDLMIDRNELTQAILNIVRNAAQALASNTSSGNNSFDNNGQADGHEAEAEKKISLQTRVIRQHNIGHKRYRLVVQVNIIDNGPGIAEDLVQNIFYPMVSGRADGSGLGLSIAQSMVGRQQGLIECTSVPGRTCFSILLPVPERGALPKPLAGRGAASSTDRNTQPHPTFGSNGAQLA